MEVEKRDDPGEWTPVTRRPSFKNFKNFNNGAQPQFGLINISANPHILSRNSDLQVLIIGFASFPLTKDLISTCSSSHASIIVTNSARET